MWQEVQDLRYNHSYRDNAIPIMLKFFDKTKKREETIERMSKQGLYFKHCDNWYKKNENSDICFIFLIGYASYTMQGPGAPPEATTV